MTNIKKLIPIILLFIVVGLAIVTTTLGTEGTTPIASNPDDFNVYFSKALVNGVEDQNIIVDKKTLYFENTVNDLGETYIIEYDITNASKQYDAEISVTCTAGNDYISVTNTLDTSKILARETRNGTLVIKKIAVNEGETITHETTCTISANAVEKDSLTETDIPTEIKKLITFEYTLSVSGVPQETATLTAEEGMTWEEWLKSSYNTIGLSNSGSKVYKYPTYLTLNGTTVLISDIIQSGETYKVSV